jgi:hypothetical protein
MRIPSEVSLTLYAVVTRPVSIFLSRVTLLPVIRMAFPGPKTKALGGSG